LKALQQTEIFWWVAERIVALMDVKWPVLTVIGYFHFKYRARTSRVGKCLIASGLRFVHLIIRSKRTV